jgi:UPF0716 protein FxsA
MWLFALFVLVPIIEIALFIQVGGLIGLWPTIAIVLVTALAGTWLMRTQGLGALMRLQRSISEFSDPTEPLADGAMILLAGALLLTPGFLTDTIGLVLLVPAIRHWVYRRIRARVKVQGFSQGATFDDGVIETEYHEIPPGAPGRAGGGPSGWTRH